MDNDAWLMFDGHQTEADLQGREAIFGLIGSRSNPEQGVAYRTSTRVDADDLISSLNRQFCQALDNPLGPTTEAGWEPGNETGRSVRGDSGLADDPHLHNVGQGSIEALLSGAQLLDHAFGPWRESDIGNLPESEPVPEILRLFAPPEYQVSTSRSKAVSLPALARREHHSLSIDSPLPMPEVTLTGNTP